MGRSTARPNGRERKEVDSMAGRFDVNFGNWLPDDEEAKLVGECCCCGREFYEGDEAMVFDGELYCDANCLAEALGAYTAELELDSEGWDN